MEFCIKYPSEFGRSYQLHFSKEGLSLSTAKKYSVLLINNQFESYCEGEPTGSIFLPVLKLNKGDHYKLIVDLNCWDLLALMETDYVDDELLIEICFGSVKTNLDAA